ncbi:MAG: 6-bladed beta-propeller [Balneolaceae bacterium]|nr:6-bladed beta-propeller [Balneolaceae bacterium]
MKLKNHKPSKKTQSLDNNLVDKKTIPRHIKKLNNLTAYSIGKKAPKKVEFNKETVFESTGNVFINGYIGNIAIDERDNVFIVGEKPGIVNIYVFGPDGSYKAKFVKEGRGPGEFESIGSLKIKNNKIYIFGPRLQKVGIFSLKDHSLINDYKIGRDIFEHDSASVYKVTDIKTVYSDGTMLARFENNNMQDPNNNRQIFYYKLSPKAIIQEGIILEQKNTFRYKPETRLTSNGYYRLPRTMPFSVSSLLVASNGKIYAAQTNEFLIMVYDKSGTYQRAFYYPYKKK